MNERYLIIDRGTQRVLRINVGYFPFPDHDMVLIDETNDHVGIHWTRQPDGSFAPPPPPPVFEEEPEPQPDPEADAA